MTTCLRNVRYPPKATKTSEQSGNGFSVVFVNGRALGGELSGGTGVNANRAALRSREACASGYWNSHRLES
jgi:hypothetical protein